MTAVPGFCFFLRVAVPSGGNHDLVSHLPVHRLLESQGGGSSGGSGSQAGPGHLGLS